MSPEAFFSRSVNVIAGHDDSALVMGYAGQTPGVITHQLAIATHTTVEGHEALTVLSADTDPASDEITEFSVSATEGTDPEVVDVHIGEDTGPGVYHLRLIQTALGEAGIALFEIVEDPNDPEDAGYWRGELQPEAKDVGRLGIEAYGVKFVDQTELVMDARFYAELAQD